MHPRLTALGIALLDLPTKRRPIPTNDIWIAALARQHQMPILSRDHHFDFVEGIQRIEW
jgi:tRNA(fMet)-specific endonuclease VapC